MSSTTERLPFTQRHRPPERYGICFPNEELTLRGAQVTHEPVMSREPTRLPTFRRPLLPIFFIAPTTSALLVIRNVRYSTKWLPTLALPRKGRYPVPWMASQHARISPFTAAAKTRISIPMGRSLIHSGRYRSSRRRFVENMDAAMYQTRDTPM